MIKERRILLLALMSSSVVAGKFDKYNEVSSLDIFFRGAS